MRPEAVNGLFVKSQQEERLSATLACRMPQDDGHVKHTIPRTWLFQSVIPDFPRVLTWRLEVFSGAGKVER